MKTEKLLEKAKIGLILNEPFFASAALKLAYEEDSTIESGSTNGLRIRYNPDFFTKIGAEERKGFIAHEVMHILLGHHLRMGDKDHDRWNVACDYAINPLLKDAGIILPKGGLFNPKYIGMSAEEIYKLLPKDDGDGDGKPNSGSGEGSGYGDVEPPPEGSDEKELEEECKQMLLEAANAAKQAGAGVSDSIKEMIKEIIEPKHNWKELLQRFVSEVVKNDYTWTKPNPRYSASGLYLPALESTEVGKIVFALDTSISIDRELLKEFVAEIKDAMNNFNVPCTVIHCDTIVRHVEELNQDDDIEPRGRGGTQFQPVFDYVNENLEDTKAIVYFTDGGSWGAFSEPCCPVLWAMYNNKHFKCDFGEIINVDKH